MRQLIRGHIVAAPSPGALDITENGYIALENGVIRCVSTERPDGFADAPIQDFGDRLILQSFADMHLHAPQYAMLGLGMDVPLLEWLQRYTYPVEARFADAGYAREVFERLAQALIANGTTRVCIFSSLHTDATLLLMEALERAGVTGYAGKVNMDRNGGDGLQETTAESRRETLRWLDACDRFSRVRPMLTPRFVPSCTDALLAFLGRLSRERKLPVQSHLSENREEMALVRRLHPDCEQYWQVYDKYGLFHSQTVMAHCVHSDARERAALRANGVLVAHAPDSNVNICSGFAPVRKLMDAGINLALGTDGAASNNNLDMFEEMHLADIMPCGYRHDPTEVSSAEVLDMATVNGARLQGRSDTGVLAVGKKADIIALDLDKPHLYPNFDTPALLTCAAHSSDVVLTMVDGKILYENGEYKTLDREKVFYEARAAVKRLYA